MKLKKQIKQQLGEMLREYRCTHGLSIRIISQQSGIDWQQIDALEIGSLKTWDVYEKLLKCYGMRLKAELTPDKKHFNN